MAELNARVLIVDDEPANILLLEEFLSDTTTEIRGLTDSTRIEQVFKEFEPDIVLLDLHMPVVDGQEVSQATEECPREPRLPAGYRPYRRHRSCGSEQRPSPRC